MRSALSRLQLSLSGDVAGVSTASYSRESATDIRQSRSLRSGNCFRTQSRCSFGPRGAGRLAFVGMPTHRPDGRVTQTP